MKSLCNIPESSCDKKKMTTSYKKMWLANPHRCLGENRKIVYTKALSKGDSVSE